MTNNFIFENKPLVSVIIPIYNSEKFIQECINSVIGQSYKNIEIILVNDGSTDRSSIICEEFCCQYSNIIIIHKENGGAGSARNAGLDRASGDFIMFVDSDDYIASDIIEKLLECHYNTNADITASKLYKTQKDTGQISIYNSNNALKGLLLNSLDCSQCAKIYKSSLLRNIRFPEGIINEDIIFLIDAYKAITKLAFLDYNFYFYRRNFDSVSNNPNSIISVYNNISVIKSRLNTTCKIDLILFANIYEIRVLLDLFIIIFRNRSQSSFNKLYDDILYNIYKLRHLIFNKYIYLEYKYICKFILALLIFLIRRI